MSKICISKR